MKILQYTVAVVLAGLLASVSPLPAIAGGPGARMSPGTPVPVLGGPVSGTVFVIEQGGSGPTPCQAANYKKGNCDPKVEGPIAQKNAEFIHYVEFDMCNSCFDDCVASSFQQGEACMRDCNTRGLSGTTLEQCYCKCANGCRCREKQCWRNLTECRQYILHLQINGQDLRSFCSDMANCWCQSCADWIPMGCVEVPQPCDLLPCPPEKLFCGPPVHRPQ